MIYHILHCTLLWKALLSLFFPQHNSRNQKNRLCKEDRANKNLVVGLYLGQSSHVSKDQNIILLGPNVVRCDMVTWSAF